MENWFRFGLWIVAFVFASFLIGLGGTVVRNLPKVEHHFTQEDFIDKATAGMLRGQLKVLKESSRVAQEAHDQAQLKLNGARANSAAARDSFNNWLATRHATKRPEQDSEVIERTQALDELKLLERKALADVERQQQALLDARQAEAGAQRALRELESAAAEKLAVELRHQELRVFGYRLALTLPLLALAGWLFARKRQSTWWPFVWGFIYFALFAFFVELVPYLPSYGGYVRYAVGIVITVLVGRYAIIALNRYLERNRSWRKPCPMRNGARSSATTPRWRAWRRRSVPAANGRSTWPIRPTTSARTAAFACSTIALNATSGKAPFRASAMPAVRRRAADQPGRGNDDFAQAALRAVFEQVDALPGAEQQASLGKGYA